jgi:hypothetical protein
LFFLLTQLVLIDLVIVDKGAIDLFEEEFQVLFLFDSLLIKVVVFSSLLRDGGVSLVELGNYSVDLDGYLLLVLCAFCVEIIMEFLLKCIEL